MLAATQANLDLFEEMLDTVLKVRNGGFTRFFDMEDWVSHYDDPSDTWACNTQGCLAGWVVHFRFLRTRCIKLEELAFNYAAFVPKKFYPLGRGKRVEIRRQQQARCYNLLFNGDNGARNRGLTLQTKRIRWFRDRIKAHLEYERIQQLPKRERRWAEAA